MQRNGEMQDLTPIAVGGKRQDLTPKPRDPEAAKPDPEAVNKTRIQESNLKAWRPIVPSDLPEKWWRQ